MSILFLALSTSSWGGGFYIGAGLGPETADFNQSVTVDYPGTVNAKNRTHLSGSGVFGSLFAGYSLRQQRFYLAGELNANASSTKFESSDNEVINMTASNLQYKIDHSFGISALPGFLLTDTTLFYGRLGYVNGNFKIVTTEVGTPNVNENLHGFRYGLGINQIVMQQFAVRLEYSRICYQDTNQVVVGGPVTTKTIISPATSQVEVGVVYSFG